ncbi:MAG: ornithine--oxo-acid transaminase [Micropruina glycogenica]|uniref:ornithine aminotransferase n=1 Tax=Micropruina glycogenica TaxID=75385 RepID=A0A2N9JJS5_9ACTN|nr:ornithine--oxo-acid transaminase [Micropruina glycogenica]SPD88304.1 ornithine aminotransferase [Micropruina glycogenica]
MTDRKGVSPAQQAAIAQTETWGAHNYLPLPVVIDSGEGAWLTDIDGNRYLDFLSAYSAVNFGHGNPVLTQAAIDQLAKVTITSRAVFSAPYGPFVKALAELCGKDMVLPMNTGVEAVESGIKLARKWGYETKGVEERHANIIVMANNFHGRTTTVISFSNDETARRNFGPFTPGFRTVPYGDVTAIADEIDDNTVAVLVEPIQGEAGVVVPPKSFLPALRELCTERNVLMIADEIQSGLGRTGKTFACEHSGVVPDLYLLGKALGGGILPVSAVVGNRDILGLLHPGQHGSTFGGNPLASAVGLAAVELLKTGELQQRSSELGEHLHKRLRTLIGNGVDAVRGKGLWAGVDIDPYLGTARSICYKLLSRGVIAKDTHEKTIRLAPPLVITEAELDQAIDALVDALAEARAEKG